MAACWGPSTATLRLPAQLRHLLPPQTFVNDVRIPDQKYVTLKLNDVIRFGYDILSPCAHPPSPSPRLPCCPRSGRGLTVASGAPGRQTQGWALTELQLLPPAPSARCQPELTQGLPGAQNPLPGGCPGWRSVLRTWGWRLCLRPGRPGPSTGWAGVHAPPCPHPLAHLLQGWAQLRLRPS